MEQLLPIFGLLVLFAILNYVQTGRVD